MSTPKKHLTTQELASGIPVSFNSQKTAQEAETEFFLWFSSRLLGVTEDTEAFDASLADGIAFLQKHSALYEALLHKWACGGLVIILTRGAKL
jgi:hypothetical protein